MMTKTEKIFRERQKLLIDARARKKDILDKKSALPDKRSRIERLLSDAKIKHEKTLDDFALGNADDSAVAKARDEFEAAKNKLKEISQNTEDMAGAYDRTLEKLEKEIQDLDVKTRNARAAYVEEVVKEKQKQIGKLTRELLIEAYTLRAIGGSGAVYFPFVKEIYGEELGGEVRVNADTITKKYDLAV